MGGIDTAGGRRLGADVRRPGRLCCVRSLVVFCGLAGGVPRPPSGLCDGGQPPSVVFWAMNGPAVCRFLGWPRSPVLEVLAVVSVPRRRGATPPGTAAPRRAHQRGLVAPAPAAPAGVQAAVSRQMAPVDARQVTGSQADIH